MEGEARDLAKAHAAIALSVAQHGSPFRAPCVILSGGEATVTVRGQGRGGCNTEFALALAMALDGHPRIHALSAGTDGLTATPVRPGPGSNQHLGTRQVARRRSHGEIIDNDSASLFQAIGSLVVTADAVNDFRSIIRRRLIGTIPAPTVCRGASAGHSRVGCGGSARREVEEHRQAGGADRTGVRKTAAMISEAGGELDYLQFDQAPRRAL